MLEELTIAVLAFALWQDRARDWRVRWMLLGLAGVCALSVVQDLIIAAPGFLARHVYG